MIWLHVQEYSREVWYTFSYREYKDDDYLEIVLSSVCTCIPFGIEKLESSGATACAPATGLYIELTHTLTLTPTKYKS